MKKIGILEMKKIGILTLMALFVAASVALPVFGANPHFVREVIFKDLGTQLLAEGSVAGLGNQNIDVSLEATGIASVDCRNPGGNIAPGQSKEFTTTATQTNIEVKNGRADFEVKTPEPIVTGAEACPNPKWTAIVKDVDFTSATITVFQPSGSGIIVLGPQLFPGPFPDP